MNAESSAGMINYNRFSIELQIIEEYWYRIQANW